MMNAWDNKLEQLSRNGQFDHSTFSTPAQAAGPGEFRDFSAGEPTGDTGERTAIISSHPHSGHESVDGDLRAW